MHSWSVRHPI